MILELIEVGFLVGDFVYHRWFDGDPPKPKPASNISIPRVEDGAPAPLVYGRCRVKSPFLAWVSQPDFHQYLDTTTYVYNIDQLFVIGIPFFEGNSRIATMWAGEVAFQTTDPQNPGFFHSSPSTSLYDLIGEGNFEDNPTTNRFVCMVTPGGFGGVPAPGANGIAGAQGGFVEFLNGNASQTLVDGSGNPTTRAGEAMVAAGMDPSVIPGFRNYICAFLRGGDADYTGTYPSGTAGPYFTHIPVGGCPHWCVGASPQAPSISFEVESFPSISFVTGYTGDEHDANPVDVLFDLLTSTIGKLGLPYAKVDAVSFAAAAATLQAEGLGFSRSWEEGRPAREYVGELMRQIDGVVFEDPVTGLIKIKLIRDDYDTATLPSISPANCVALQNFAFGGQSDAPNKVRIQYMDRRFNYQDGGATAHNEANAVGQDGSVREIQLQMPGICTAKIAQVVAARELAARSRPLMKCRATVDRSFRNLLPGDAVKLTWPEYAISGVVFRVANIDRGLLEDGKIALDLIQDYYYVWRNLPPVPVGIRGFPIVRPVIVR